MGWSLEHHREHTEGMTPRIPQGNHPEKHTRVRSQECSLGYAPGGNMSGWRPELIQVMSLTMPLGRFLGIFAGYNHQCAPVPLGVYMVRRLNTWESSAYK